MKVLSVQQPFATLIALGEKKFETRSWATKHRGELAIHASKKMSRAIRAICNREPFKSILAKYGFTADNLPLGKIIAICNLSECFEVHTASEIFRRGAFLKNGKRTASVTGNEYVFGDYTPGRFAWELADVKQINPIPAKGQLGLWNYQEGEMAIKHG
jgi:hypothetical protein